MKKCLYSWGSQYDENDFSDLHECTLERGHIGLHEDGIESYDPDRTEIAINYIKSQYPLGTQNGLNYHVYPSEER